MPWQTTEFKEMQTDLGKPQKGRPMGKPRGPRRVRVLRRIISLWVRAFVRRQTLLDIGEEEERPKPASRGAK